MFWFCKRKKVVVDAFTPHESVKNEYPIDVASKFLPQWWKDAQPSYLVDDLAPHPTIKSCPGIIDLYSKGFMIPLWTDVVIEVQPEIFRWQAADERAVLSSHTPEQWNMFVDSHQFAHLKLSNTWSIRTKENINWVFMAPYWNQNPADIYSTPPGIVNSYYTYMPLNIQLMISRKALGMFNLHAGDPIAHVIPMTDKDIQIKTHVIDQKDWDKYYAHPGIGKSRWLNSYKHAIKKCPFHG